MAFAINEIKGALKGGGARPALFEANITGAPVGLGQLRFFCQATDLPAEVIGQVEVPYFGRKIKLAGDRTYEDWTVTVLNDEDFAIRNAMEQWTDIINEPRANTRTGGYPPTYKNAQGEIIQYKKDGGKIRTYKLEGLFPTNVSTIPVDWNTTDTIETFTVTFAFDLWTAS